MIVKSSTANTQPGVALPSLYVLKALFVANPCVSDWRSAKRTRLKGVFGACGRNSAMSGRTLTKRPFLSGSCDAQGESWDGGLLYSTWFLGYTVGMDSKTLAILEYGRVRSEIGGYCMSAEGRDFVCGTEPSAVFEEVHRKKQLSFEWMCCLESSRPPVLAGWQPCRHLFQALLVEGAALGAEDAFALGQFCLSVRGLKSGIAALQGSLSIPLMAEIADRMPDLGAAEQEIFRVLDPSGQIRDLPQIRAIRSSIAQIRRDIELLMKKYTSDAQLRDALQSPLPTIRGDRQVLAVKANFKGRVRGIVHEVSQTGQTLYIEPDDVVRRNNEVIQEQQRLVQEIRRILRDLTGKLMPFYDAFCACHGLMLPLDAGRAAAKWGVENGCLCAQDCAGGSASKARPLALIKARHPLLGAQAVPIDIVFLPEKRVLIITGPNTGGKTVSLKTVGLFAAMNQSGFPLPAAEGTMLPVFDDIFADIGDEQSLDQSLSTFSAHIKNIARIAGAVSEKTLVLLDELGSGTDPEEGGAIAMAVLDYLIEKGSLVISTTHHGILKNYGYTHASCVNASVDFNESTLSPTYHILMGIPGESHALEIARRNGLLDCITERAREYIVSEQADVSALIKGLIAKHEELFVLEREQRVRDERTSEKMRLIEARELQLRQRELALREQGHRESAEFLAQSRRDLENLVRELREGEITREKTLKVKKFSSDAAELLERQKADLLHEREAALELERAIESREREKQRAKMQQSRLEREQMKKKLRMEAELEQYAAIPLYNARQQAQGERLEYPKALASGLDVFFGRDAKRGTLVRRDKKGTWIVQAGSLKLSVKEKDISLAPVQQKNASVSVEMASDAAEARAAVGSARAAGAASDAGMAASHNTPVYELRLLGMRFEEAVQSLERQLDLAVLSGLKGFCIIHGKGSGVLQHGVHEYLKNRAEVDQFYFARPEDGGTGKTYVVMK